MASKIPTYVFRGTTKGFPGGKNSIEIPYACTTWHPVKALWFALACYRFSSEKAVVYVALTEKFAEIASGQNMPPLCEIENEIAFFMQPTQFYHYCEGYIHVTDFQSILKDFGINGYRVVDRENLTKICGETPSLTFRRIDELVKAIVPFLKK